MDQVLPPAEEGTSRLKFTYTKCIYEGRSQVYRGVLSGPGECQERRVVCKFIDGDTCPMNAEARVYTINLAPLQGQDVPELIGFFRAPAKDPRLAVACLLFEDFGRALTAWLGDYPMAIR